MRLKLAYRGYCAVFCICLLLFYKCLFHKSSYQVEVTEPVRQGEVLNENVCIKDGPCIPAQHMDSWNHQRFPSAIIIGAKKCGTRALLNMLGSHPNIKTLYDEGHFFDDNISYSLGNNWYRSIMPLLEGEQIAVEKTPSYIRTSYVPQRVFDFNRNMKIIAILREPLSRLLSDYAQLQLLRRERKWPPLGSFANVYINNKTGRVTNRKELLVGEYVTHLTRWYKYFPRQQIMVINGNEFATDPLKLLPDLEVFLGVKAYFDKSNIYFNSTRGFHCYLEDGLPQCMGKKKGRKHNQINEWERNILIAHYKLFNEKLFKLIGKSFDW